MGSSAAARAWATVLMLRGVAVSIIAGPARESAERTWEPAVMESWSVWERETLAEQQGDFEALLSHLRVEPREEAADPGAPGGSLLRSGQDRQVRARLAGRPLLRLVHVRQEHRSPGP
jgi:hypothetical protein